MDARVTPSDDITVVELVGGLDLAARDEVRAALASALSSAWGNRWFPHQPLLHERIDALRSTWSGMGPVAQLVFKTSAVV